MGGFALATTLVTVMSGVASFGLIGGIIAGAFGVIFWCYVWPTIVYYIDYNQNPEKVNQRLNTGR